VDFLLVLIEHFSLRVTAEALRANVGSEPAISLQREPFDHKTDERTEGILIARLRLHCMQRGKNEQRILH